MKFLFWAFAALTVALVAAALGLAIHSEMPPVYIVFDLNPITMLAVLVLVGLLVAGLFAPARKESDLTLLNIFLWIGFGLGFAASALDLLSIWSAVKATNTTNLKVIGPSLANGLVPLAAGSLVAAIAAFRGARIQPD